MSNHPIIETDVVVLGSGPGGYPAAFRMADLSQEQGLGLSVTLVEAHDSLGGVCLNVGCIPSKALLHVAKVIEEAKALGQAGVVFGKPSIDAKKLLEWKRGVIKQLTQGLSMLSKKRQVKVVVGRAEFKDAHHLKVSSSKGEQIIHFKKAVIAAGSEPIKLPFVPEDRRIFNSTGALELRDIKGDLLVIGGGIIGLEMATVYRALGAKVTVVELSDQLVPGCDSDIIQILHNRLSEQSIEILLGTKVTGVEASKSGLKVSFEGKQAPSEPRSFKQILVAVGRRPNAQALGCDQAGIQVNERGFVAVDEQLRTNIPHIYAVGDITEGPMLAHKATAQGRLAAEVMAGKSYYFQPRCIPSVAYTDPEVAWAGLTEQAAKAQGIAYEMGVFPWMASGRALSNARTDGATKLLFDPKTDRLLGAVIVGPNAGELIGECALAIEMGCDASDIALTIHPHPTLCETIAMATEMYEGTITDLYVNQKKKHKK